jgi:hypothetical protein
MRRIKTLDVHGQTVIVIEVPGRRIPTTTLRSTHREHVEGMRSYQLENGDPVNMISDTEFKTMQGNTLTIVK